MKFWVKRVEPPLNPPLALGRTKQLVYGYPVLSGVMGSYWQLTGTVSLLKLISFCVWFQGSTNPKEDDRRVSPCHQYSHSDVFSGLCYENSIYAHHFKGKAWDDIGFMNLNQSVVEGAGVGGGGGDDKTLECLGQLFDAYLHIHVCI